MEHPEVPLEHAQEQIMHHAHGETESWVMGVALTAAILAVLAAITALLAEHHANEAMLDQIRSSDDWSHYQAKSIKEKIAQMKVDLLAAEGKPAGEKDSAERGRYEEEEKEIAKKAEEEEHASAAHLRNHTILSFGVTMFQVAIAVGAIAVLTKRKRFWHVAMSFGLVGSGFLVAGLVVSLLAH
jgi:uncharacterized membrane protein